MIKIVEKNLFDSKANFIVHQVNWQGVMGSGVAKQVAEQYPYVDKEYRKYVFHYQKKNKKILGTVQYVPTEVWAIGLVDTLKNDKIEKYDKDYQYIVNLFGQESYGAGFQTDLKEMKNAFIDIRDKAMSVGATIAMPFKIGCVRGGANWADVYTIIEDVFKDSGLDVEICKCNLK